MRPGITATRDRTVLRLWGNPNVTVAEIAQEAECDPATVYAVARRAGLYRALERGLKHERGRREA